MRMPPIAVLRRCLHAPRVFISRGGNDSTASGRHPLRQPEADQHSQRMDLGRCMSTGLLGLASFTAAADVPNPPLPNPIVFVAQMPPMRGYPSLNDVFTNHLGGPEQAPRGSDLYILYPDGMLKNLTAAAGWGCTQPICATPGSSGQAGYPEAQDPKGNLGGIAVRDPEPHWNGQRLVFSMIVGSPGRFQVHDWRWQLYEVSGLGPTDTPVISKVPNQPEYSNVQPSYLSDGRILFASARPQGNRAYLYPQHDEYESQPIVSGLYVLNPSSGEVRAYTHSPSGDFHPRVIADGRIVFNRWDHLIRDQQADADLFQGGGYGTFTYASEAADAVRMPISGTHEIFPEPRQQAYINILYPGSNMVPHAMNLFMPWELRQDGTTLETLNHWGRHEQMSFFERSFNDDPALVPFSFQAPMRPNQHATDNFHDLRELPGLANHFVAVRTVEFGARGAGQLLFLDHSEAGMTPTLMRSSAATHPNTFGFRGDNDPERPGDSGRYRDPAPLIDGRLLAAHSPETRAEATSTNPTTEVINGQTVAVSNPSNRHEFRLRLLSGTPGDLAAAGPFLTGSEGIRKTTAFWRPDDLVRYTNVRLWETDPVELRQRTPPPTTQAPSIAAAEQAVFDAEAVDPVSFRSWLAERGLGVIVVRNNTSRDSADRQQPFNLRVPGGVQTTSVNPPGAQLYDIDKLEVLQGDLVRGKGGISNPLPGRRVLARPLHDTPFPDLQVPGFAGSYPLASDGSAAIIVPAQRALTWQSLSPGGLPVVRERVWVSLQPGEIRVCGGCHGVNDTDQAGNAAAGNSPLALQTLLQHWKQAAADLFNDGFE